MPSSHDASLHVPSPQTPLRQSFDSNTTRAISASTTATTAVNVDFTPVGDTVAATRFWRLGIRPRHATVDNRRFRLAFVGLICSLTTRKALITPAELLRQSPAAGTPIDVSAEHPTKQISAPKARPVFSPFKCLLSTKSDSIINKVHGSSKGYSLQLVNI